MTASGETWIQCEEHATVKKVPKPESQSGRAHPVYRVGDGITAPRPIWTLPIRTIYPWPKKHHFKATLFSSRPLRNKEQLMKFRL